ncbi:hypothetical protein ACFT5B_15275 [Luteimicrobium sp. NPDC057192]|uniref:hypothetical protein n=1 Tax=Luteimicrobium sp. NPDC057192 TaxID=3346042 RepID=UPI00363DC1F8
MNTPQTRSARPAYASPVLWALIIVLGLANVALQLARGLDFLIQDNWTWAGFAIGMVTLALVLWVVVSFVRTRLLHGTRRG